MSSDDDFDALVQRRSREAAQKRASAQQAQSDKQQKANQRRVLVTNFALRVPSQVHNVIALIAPKVNGFADLRVVGSANRPEVIEVAYTDPPNDRRRTAKVRFALTETGQVATVMTIPDKPEIREEPIPLDSFSQDNAERAIKRLIAEAGSAA
jgi:hypothetical protein